MMAERLRTVSVGGGDCESDIGISNDFFSSSIHSEPSLMNTSQISTSSQDSQRLIKPSHNLPSKKVGTSICRFPKLEECAHFHYERVQLGQVLIRLIDENRPDIVNSGSSIQGDSQAPHNNHWFIIKVSAGRSEPYLIKRSLQNLILLDEMLHRCVYDRRISDLQDLANVGDITDDEELEDIVSIYLSRLSTIASDAMTCGPVLTWFQLDNKGRRLPVADSDTMTTINTPAVGAAYGIRRYVAQACDEISIEVGDMISVIDMPSPAESTWWRGKKNHFQKNQYEVGFFPQNCVATIGEKVPRHMPLPAPLVGSLAISPTKPVLRKHGKLITFFRSFILARPSRRRLKQSGIYKERVFSCDLGEHLMNSGLDIPMVLKCCAEFIEEFGIVDGVYRLSGITSNIQRLRRGFDEEIIPDLTQPDIRQDIHAVTSLLKMYFRELPNPLCTYQLYDNFVEAIQAKTDVEDLRLKMIRQTVRKLPPPHYRTLKYLACHLNRIAKHSNRTGMTERNIAIVWAPNLLRSPALESGGVAALRGVGVQAVVTEYLIVNSEQIFDDANDEIDNFNSSSQPNSLSDTSSIHIEARDASLLLIERPKSLGIGPPKLISLEEAQIRKKEKEIEKSIPIITSTHNACSSYIEVGGGPASLPDKYHTVLPVPRSWNKRKTHSWKSIFQRGDRRSTSSNVKSKFISNPIAKENVDKNEIKESIKVLPVIKSASNSNNSSFKEKTKLTKSADMLDTGPRSLTVDVSCPRSCSIDSLRTPGHSRSVSHDSYFDLLQSPLRGGMTTTCPSRELSELGLNFDREEPEMRLFSESESLVSSPKVTKDNVPRRVLRARPEECSNTANSVNPSPKKQPRLNLSSPGELKTWASIINEATNESSKDDDESLCKRTKLEDQLSDIQFIDCNTPEHSITANSNVNTGYTIYTQIQIHNPPSIFSDRQEQHKTIINTTTSPPASETANERYSYPVTQYTTFAQQSKKDDRFSYPIAITTTEKSTVDKSNENVQKMNISESPPTILGVTKKTNITDTSDSQRNSDVMSKSKLSIQTPSSPMKSPCYSLLIGSTASSATPSPANTPTYDMDICSHYEPIEFSAKEVVVRQANEEKKTEMSLDLKNRISVTSPETSQSMTPSEIGYQNLYNRQYSVTPELDDAIKPTIVTVSSPAKLSPQASGKVSPIKSTINITYNLKSPKAESNEPNKFFSDEMKKEGLLETSFDDTMVYEQVKFFKSAVDQVNDLVDGKTPTQPQKEETYAEDQYEVVFKNDKMMMMSDIQMKDERGKEEQVHELKVDFDQELEAQDSLEFDQNMSLYENVEVKKPEKVYENVPLPSSLTNSPVRQLKVTFDKNCSNDELESGRHEEKSDLSFTNVRKLANKFETSPIDCQPSYDFNSSPSRKSEVQLRKTNRNPDLYTITRSLDENAFIREFGSARKFEEFNKSINEIADRRKSIDYSKPKSLNQPKKLPGLQTTNNQEKHEHCKKTIGDVEHKLKLNITNEEDYVDSQRSPSFNPERTPLQNFNVRITPTTENRISLIQSNFEDKKLEDGKSTSLSNLKTLKLDRERIEKIKEERRHQLNEKYRSESFRNLNNNVKITKPKSKTELDIDDFHDDIAINNQRFKVKIHTNFDQPSSLTSTSSSSITNLTSRTRRISDEKNQNDIDSGSDDQVVLRKKETDESSSDSKSSNRSKFEKRTFETSRERNNSSNSLRFSQTSNQTERYSPQISIKDVAAIFESRASQKQTN